MDPQQRFFLEGTWEALEHAGYAPGTFKGSTGVFAGSGPNSYLIYNLLSDPELVQKEGIFLLRHTGNDKDVLATRASYQMNLKGPSVNVQTACSTSLVALHLACQSLLEFSCDMALAGAVSIEIPHAIGYPYRQTFGFDIKENDSTAAQVTVFETLGEYGLSSTTPATLLTSTGNFKYNAAQPSAGTAGFSFSIQHLF